MQKEILDIFSHILFFLILSMSLLWFLIVFKFVRYLEKHHFETYRKLGCPNFFTNNTQSNGIAFLRFFSSNASSALGDKDLVRKCAFLRKYFYVYWFLFVTLLLIVIISKNS